MSSPINEAGRQEGRRAPVGVGIQGLKAVQGSRVQEGFHAGRVVEEIAERDGAPVVGELDPLPASRGQISRSRPGAQFVPSGVLGLGHCFASPFPPRVPTHPVGPCDVAVEGSVCAIPGRNSVISFQGKRKGRIFLVISL